jgi:hypothetical protein
MTTTSPEAPETEDRRGAPAGRFGNVAFVPSDEQRAKVRTLAKTFPEHSNHRIAILVGVSRSTLEKHFREDLDYGRAEMLASVGAQVINAALDSENASAKGDRDLQKFILARLGGWSTKVEMSGKDGRPIEHVDLTRLSPEQLDAYGRLAAIAEGKDPDEVVGSASDTDQA